MDADADVHVRSKSWSDDEFLGDIRGDSTPLHLAVGVLIDAEAHVMAKNDGGLTPLHRARNAGVVDALISAGAGTEHEDDEGRTPLERALECAKDFEVVRALLDGGADVEHLRVEQPDDDLNKHVFGTPLANSTDNEDMSLLTVDRTWCLSQRVLHSNLW